MRVCGPQLCEVPAGAARKGWHGTALQLLAALDRCERWHSAPLTGARLAAAEQLSWARLAARGARFAGVQAALTAKYGDAMSTGPHWGPHEPVAMDHARPLLAAAVELLGEQRLSLAIGDDYSVTLHLGLREVRDDTHQRSREWVQRGRLGEGGVTRHRVSASVLTWPARHGRAVYRCDVARHEQAWRRVALDAESALRWAMRVRDEQAGRAL